LSNTNAALILWAFPLLNPSRIRKADKLFVRLWPDPGRLVISYLSEPAFISAIFQSVCFHHMPRKRLKIAFHPIIT
jgi:hypothetical protein